jgi:hypothetical protein
MGQTEFGSLIRKSYLAECVKNLIEVDQYLALGYLSNVVHTLAGVVSYTGILIGEAGQDWGNDFCKISSNFLAKNNNNRV